MARTEVTRELLRIQSLNGGLLRAVDVVEEARHPASPLHNHFQWDDSLAGHQWRLQQARQLIRVAVEYLPYEEPRYAVHAFVSLTPDRVQENGGYRVMAEVLAAPSQRAQMLADALDELNRLKTKYYQLSELSGVFAAIERAIRTHGEPPPQDFDNGDGISAP